MINIFRTKSLLIEITFYFFSPCDKNRMVTMNKSTPVEKKSKQNSKNPELSLGDYGILDNRTGLT